MPPQERGFGADALTGHWCDVVMGEVTQDARSPS